jgi:hypothetical protein
VLPMDALDRNRPLNPARVGLAWVLVLAVLWALSLAVSPQLHEWIHPDADHEDHDCAVTLFSSGGINIFVVDLASIASRSDRPFIDVIRLSSQVAYSAQSACLLYSRGPPLGLQRLGRATPQG